MSQASFKMETEQLIHEHIYIPITVAQHMQHRYASFFVKGNFVGGMINYEDVRQECTLQLVRIANKFQKHKDRNKNVKFKDYAFSSIYGKIKQYLFRLIKKLLNEDTGLRKMILFADLEQKLDADIDIAEVHSDVRLDILMEKEAIGAILDKVSIIYKKKSPTFKIIKARLLGESVEDISKKLKQTRQNIYYHLRRAALAIFLLDEES